MNESNAQNQNNDFSKIARIKRFLRVNKKNFISLAICFSIVVFFLAVIVISAATDSDDYLNYENYEKIEIGMTYEDVVTLFNNHHGKSNAAGRGGSIYTWSNDSGTCKIIISFDEDDRVAKKSQSGLD